jgi:hypothetical protein
MQKELHDFSFHSVRKWPQQPGFEDAKQKVGVCHYANEKRGDTCLGFPSLMGYAE